MSQKETMHKYNDFRFFLNKNERIRQANKMNLQKHKKTV